MKNTIPVIIALSYAFVFSACITSKTISSEKALEAWLETATMPVTVQFQSNVHRCRPSLNCYTLIDAKGRVHYARNVRHTLPNVIPHDPNAPLPTVWEELLLGRRRSW
jgi:hypothetical protein